jgi:hypothetical protein
LHAGLPIIRKPEASDYVLGPRLIFLPGRSVARRCGFKKLAWNGSFALHPIRNGLLDVICLNLLGFFTSSIWSGERIRLARSFARNGDRARIRRGLGNGGLQRLRGGKFPAAPRGQRLILRRPGARSPASYLDLCEGWVRRRSAERPARIHFAWPRGNVDSRRSTDADLDVSLFSSRAGLASRQLALLMIRR